MDPRDLIERSVTGWLLCYYKTMQKIEEKGVGEGGAERRGTPGALSASG